MIQLAYRSASTVDDGSSKFFVDIAQILHRSLANNPRLGITGVLTCSGGWFTQILEGPVANVDALFARLGDDGRHSSLQVLSRRVVATRSFAAWSMAYVGRGDGPRIVELLAAGDPTPAAYQAAVEELADCIC